jgi:hypothetical protein
MVRNRPRRGGVTGLKTACASSVVTRNERTRVSFVSVLVLAVSFAINYLRPLHCHSSFHRPDRWKSGLSTMGATMNKMWRNVGFHRSTIFHHHSTALFSAIPPFSTMPQPCREVSFHRGGFSLENPPRDGGNLSDGGTVEWWNPRLSTLKKVRWPGKNDDDPPAIGPASIRHTPRAPATSAARSLWAERSENHGPLADPNEAVPVPGLKQSTSISPPTVETTSQFCD